jgi:hypothetical protein
MSPSSSTTLDSFIHDADVIRDMIRHEENLIISRAHWLVTLQAILFAGLAFSWEQDRALSLTLVGFGVATALMFFPHLSYGNSAIQRLELWFQQRHGQLLDHPHPPLRGLSGDIPWYYQVLLNWRALPSFFLVGWFIVAVQRW